MLLVIAAIPYIDKSQWISILMWRWMLNVSMFFNWYMCCQVLFFLKFIVFSMFIHGSYFLVSLASKMISIELTAKWLHGIHLGILAILLVNRMNAGDRKWKHFFFYQYGGDIVFPGHVSLADHSVVICSRCRSWK